MLLIGKCLILLVSMLGTQSTELTRSREMHGLIGKNKCPQELKGCKCDERLKKVVCKGLGLKKVPHNIPPDTKILDLGGNRIDDIPNGAFQNLTMLEELVLNGNPISTIGNETLLGLTHLSSLNLQSTLNLTIDVLDESVFKALRYSNITYLRMAFMNFSLKADSLAPLQNKSIVYLEISANRQMCNLPDNAFSGLQVRSLYMDNCQCHDLNEKAFQDSAVTTLTLSRNHLWKFPLFKGMRGIQQSLQSINLLGNSISDLDNHILTRFPNLNTIILTSNDFDHIQSDTFFSLPSLAKLYLDDNRIKHVTAKSFHSNTLRKIHLEGNQIRIRNEDANIFRYMTAIEEIYLGPAHLPDKENENHLFANISTLRKLSLSNTDQLYHVKQFFLGGLYNLTTLTLNSNNIQLFQPGSLSDLVSLKSLSLIANEISVVNTTFFPQHILRNLDSIDLSSNPFECTCRLFWLLDWIHSNEHKVKSFVDPVRPQYVCASPPEMMGTPLNNLHLTAEECLREPFSSGLMIVLSIGSAQLAVVLLLSIIYRIRWSIRLQLFHLGNWWRAKYYKKDAFTLNQNDYLFDLFVSHNVKDTHWVHQVLVPELEQKSQPPFKLCLYNRNWLVGHDIANCILESLSRSRKTLLLVTNAFTKSEWCQFELTMAQHKLIEMDNDNVVLAIMEDIQPINLTPRLALMMKRKTYLEWTDNPSGQQLFWEKLKSLLHSKGATLTHEVPSEHDCNALLNPAS